MTTEPLPVAFPALCESVRMYPTMRQRRLCVIGILLLLCGAALVYAVLLGSRSAEPWLLGRFSLKLGVFLLLYGLLLLAAVVILISGPDRAVRFTTKAVNLYGRVPLLPEITFLLGWLPVPFLILAGSGLTPLAAEGGFLWGLLLVYVGFALMLLVALETGRRRALLERSAVLAVTLVLLLAGLELAIRILSPGNVFDSVIELHPHQRIVIDVDLPGMSPRALHTTNRWGLRGEEPPEVWSDWLTIVTLGGSTTHCYYMDDSKTWSNILQQELRRTHPEVWVGNGGLSGHSTRGHIHFMRDIIPVIDPDMVVLLVGTNDVIYSTRAGLAEEGIEAERASSMRRLLLSSRLLQTVYVWARGAFTREHMMTEDLPPYERRPLEGNEIPVPEDIREICTTIDDFRANLETIIELGREAGVQVVFMTQPSLWDDTDYWRRIQESHYWIASEDTGLSAATVWRILDEFNGELLAVCSEQSVPCFDLASVVPHSVEYFYDGMHLNEAGAELVGHELGRFLLEEGLLGELLAREPSDE